MSLELDISPGQALDAITEIVQDQALDQPGADLGEVERTYEDAHNYVSFLLSTDPGERVPSVRIELGVRDEEHRRAIGGFKGQWDHRRGEIVGVQAIVRDGQYCSPGSFLRLLEELLLQIKSA